MADKFLPILTEVVGRSASFLRTQVPRLGALWNDFWQFFEPVAPQIRPVAFDADQFMTDLDYRIETLDALEGAVVDGYHAERALFVAIFQKMLPNPDLGKYFSVEARPLVGYKIAETLVGSLGQFIALNPALIPINFVVVAKHKSMLRLKGMSTSQLVGSLMKSNVACSAADVEGVMAGLASLGQVTVSTRDGEAFYSGLQPFDLPAADDAFYRQNVHPVLEWAVQLWRSFYNLRDLDTPIAPERKWASFLAKTVSRAATQGFQSAHFVVKNVSNYWKMLKKGSPDLSG